MRTIWRPVMVLVLGLGFGHAATTAGPLLSVGTPGVQPTPPPATTSRPPSGSPSADASTVILPCIPVAAYWTGPPPSEGMPPGPDLAIVSIDVRPKDASVYLDDRFVGLARYFDGTPGYLYLVPGGYHLEIRQGGYRTVAVDLAAEAGCRYDLKHRLDRIKGTPKEHKANGPEAGKPFNRVYEPLQPAVQPGAEVRRGGPDSSLRPDIDPTGSRGAEHRSNGAALKLSVNPDSAAIAIDGAFVATARELKRMEGPLAVAQGSHQIEISAPGFQTVTQPVELAEGQVLELSFDLVKGPGGPQ